MNPCVRRQTEGLVALSRWRPLEPDRGGDDVLGLRRGDNETDRVALAANDIALGSQPHLALDRGARGRGEEGASAWMTEAPTIVRNAAAMSVGVFMA